MLIMESYGWVNAKNKKNLAPLLTHLGYVFIALTRR